MELPQDYSIEAIKSKWLLPKVNGQTSPKFQSHELLQDLCQAIEYKGKSRQEEPEETSGLEEFLDNKDGKFWVDDCVMWLMLSSLVLEPETQARETLAKTIVEIRPMLAFFPTNKDSFAFRTWERQAKDDYISFEWTCMDKHHETSLNKAFQAYESPFTQFITFGITEMVKHTIDQTNAYFGKSIPQQTPISRAIAIGRLEQSEKGTALEIALETHCKALIKNKEDLSSASMEIFEYLLDFNPPPDDGDHILREAIRKADVDIIKKILNRTPAILKDQLILEQLNDPGRNLQITEELIRSLGNRSRIGNDIFKAMVTVDIPSLWELSPIGKLLAEGLETNQIDGSDLLYQAISSEKRHIVKRVVQSSPGTFDLNVARKMIELNRWEIWEQEIKAAKGVLLLKEFGPDLLSFAVKMQRDRFVEDFVKDTPGLVLELYPKETSHHDSANNRDQCIERVYPLWHNNFKIRNGKETVRKTDTDAKRRIRKILVSTCIRMNDNMESLCEIFQHSGESIADISLDLSQFNSKFFPFNQLIKSLVRYKGAYKIASYHYEPTLRYVDFPALDLSGHDRREDRYQSHSEVFDLLNWLQVEHGVGEIIKLKVPDRMYNPHDERTIALMVKRFQIQVLDWRFLDLSISVFRELKPDVSCLRSLHLYASGKRAVVSHWLSSTGIQSLPEVKAVKVHLVEELMSESQARTLRDILTKGFTKLRNSRPGFTFEVDLECWDIQPVRSNASLGHIAGKAVPKLWPLIDAYSNHVGSQKNIIRRNGWKATRIAIIDNGIMSVAPFSKGSDDITALGAESPQVDGLPSRNGQQTPRDHDKLTENNNEEVEFEDQLNDLEGKNGRESYGEDKPNDNEDLPHSISSRVVKGRSFLADEHRLGSWSFASDPHGTQMANLICAIDPHCEILVAKVTEGRIGIDAEHLASAIKWAVDERVDIISMSLAAYELDSENKLVAEIDSAAKKGVLMLCAAHDEGLNRVRSYPANMDGTITIAASNQFGGATENAPGSKDYDYRFHATNITIGVVPFVKSEETISGSSVATAIAAGLSSVILSCRRLAMGSTAESSAGWRSMIVKRKFDQTKDNDSKYIQLDKFCDIGERVKASAPIDMEEIIEQFNGENLPYVR